MNKTIAVIGAGSWGTALANLLAKKGYNVKVWVYCKDEREELVKYRENKRYLPGIPLSENIEFSCDMNICICNAELIVCAVPSKAVKSVAEQLAGLINVEKQKLITVSKGLDSVTFERISQVYRRIIPGVEVTVLSGPSHAEEVATEQVTTNVAACDNEQTAELVQEVFMTDYFRVYTNTDMIGVELGGALKNVIALCAGVLDGMGMGDNAKAALMTRGMTEISRLGVKLGAKLETFYGLTGMGDLIVTCTSMHSRNRRAGILIGQGNTVEQATKEVQMVVEGIPATIAAYNLAKQCRVEMPIVNATYAVICEGADVKKCVAGLMTRPRKNENEELIEK